jgi:hypothetical protein
MRYRQFAGHAGVVNAVVALVVTAVVVGMPNAVCAQGAARAQTEGSFYGGTAWQLTAGQAAVPAPNYQVRPGSPQSPRMAMLDGDVVMDGGVMTDSGVMMDDGSGIMTEPCESCRMPPWHGNVASPYQCGPVCDPCVQPHRRSCFPRLYALFSEGHLVSPIPPCEPRCQHCGAMVQVGF